ncbi:MAG: hypothetical protein U0Y68_14620 [Blastocatellia bacterium]
MRISRIPRFSCPQLRSHSDQVQQMQTGIPSSSGSSGWGGRTLDNLAGEQREY